MNIQIHKLRKQLLTIVLQQFWSLAKRKSKDKDDGQPENGDLKDLNNNCNDETGRNWSAHCYSNNVETEK